jgi:hypothetical protein
MKEVFVFKKDGTLVGFSLEEQTPIDVILDLFEPEDYTDVHWHKVGADCDCGMRLG